MTFETRTIYAVNPDDGCLDRRFGSVRVKDESNFDAAQIGTAPFTVTGLGDYDLALFGRLKTDVSVTDHGLLVLSSRGGEGRVASSDAVYDRESLQTIDLARKCATLLDEELAQLSIDSIVAKLKMRYPEVMG